MLLVMIKDVSVRSSYSIALIHGDGIGHELIESAVAVLTALADGTDGMAFVFTDVPGGAEVYRTTGRPMADDDLERMGKNEFDAVLKGPVGLPDVRRPDGTEGGLLGGVLRIGLDTYANVRPIKLLPRVRTPVRYEAGQIDYVIIRENTEGLYLSRGLGVANRWAASDQLMVTREGCLRVARVAFEMARKRAGAPADGVRRVTLVDKSNVLRSFAFMRRVTQEVAADYPDVELDFRYSDAAAHDLVADPSHFDVVLAENFLGDLLSDLGAATVGGLGMCPSANVGDGAAYFEPIHGSAPGIAGTGSANPTSQILSAALLLDHLGETAAADRVRQAVTTAYASGRVELNAQGQPLCGTGGVTQAVIDSL